MNGMTKNIMEKTGKTTVSMDALEHVLFYADRKRQIAVEYKKSGDLDHYFDEIGEYIAIKNALEMLGLVIKEDYDFNDGGEE